MWTKFAVVLLMVGLFSAPTLAQVVPELPPDTFEDITGAAEDLNELPDSIEGEVQLPDTPDPEILYSYVKYLFSFDVAQELLGERLAWVGLALYHFLLVITPLMSVYAIVNVITIGLKFLKWVISLIIKLIELIPFAQ